jgi:transcriptional regulator with XRE-family HTH domain
MRKRRGMSRKALASRVRVRVGVVGAWERGENLPTGDKVIEVMLALEVTPAELMAAGEKTSARVRAMEARAHLKGEGP